MPKIQAEPSQANKSEPKAAKHNLIKDEVLPKLIKAASNRPAKEESLKNFIKSHVISLRNDEAGVNKAFNALIEKKLIKLEGKKITYSLKKSK